MKYTIASLILAVLPSFSLAQAPSPLRMSAYPQEDILVHEQSLSFLKRGFPQRDYNASWIGKSTRTLLVSSAAHYRHMPAMIVAGFAATKKVDQENAFKWLEVYECENYLACSDYEQFLTSNIQSHANLNGILKLKANVILEKVKSRLKTMAQVPAKTGFCPQSGEEQAKWLVMAYQLYCAPYDIASNPRGCAMLTAKPQACSATEGLVDSLRRWTAQDSLSSSRLMSFEHSLKKACESAWTVKTDCEVSGQMVKTEFSCTAQLQKYPAQVVCQAKTR